MDFYCIRTLPPIGTNKPVTLGERKEKSGLAYLVVEMSVDSDTAQVRRLTDSELTEVKKRNPGFSMSEAWLCFPVDNWFKIVGPHHSLRSACVHQESQGGFAMSGAWNSSATPTKPSRINFTIGFEVEQKLAELGKMSFQFRWHRHMPLTKAGLSHKPKHNDAQPSP